MFALAAELSLPAVPPVSYTHKVRDSQFGHSAIYRAVQRQSSGCLDLLLQAGCDPDYTSSSRAPLLQAVELRSLQMTKQLLAHGANPDCADPMESTPVMIAAKNGCTAILKALLDAGAGVFIRDRAQLNALGHAIAGSQLPIVRELLKRGAMARGNASQAEYALGLAEATARQKRDVASNELLVFLANRAAAASIGAGQVHELSPIDSSSSAHDAESSNGAGTTGSPVHAMSAVSSMAAASSTQGVHK